MPIDLQAFNIGRALILLVKFDPVIAYRHLRVGSTFPKSYLMAKSVFDFQNYKTYLLYRTEAKRDEDRGVKAQLADALGCQRSFVSQVLHKNAHFSLEHGARINRFFGHDSEESHFFILLILYSRAGTDDLREYFRSQMKEVISKRLILKNRLESDVKLPKETQSRYYSAWYYGAIRVAVAVPELRTIEALASRFGLTRKKTREILEFLAGAGLVELKNGQYTPTAKHIHLGNDSGLIVQHHTNWRLQCLKSLEVERKADLHFSGAVTLAQEDAVKLKAILVRQIEEFMKLIGPSKEETIYSFCMDFFEL